jgi:hypothetical protein
MLTAPILNRILILSGALWCVAGISAGMLRSTELDAPRPAPEPLSLAAAEVVTITKSDRLPISTPQAFGERWPIMVSEPVTTAARKDVPQTVGATVSARRHHPQIDRVCGAKGRRWFTRHHWRVWRCRR